MWWVERKERQGGWQMPIHFQLVSQEQGNYKKDEDIEGIVILKWA
jgi:hypothetical protein